MSIHRFKKDERVRAALSITYGWPPGMPTIPAGTRGVVELVSLGGFLPHVRWQGQARALQTSFDSLELLDDDGEAVTPKTATSCENDPQNADDHMETP